MGMENNGKAEEKRQEVRIAFDQATQGITISVDGFNGHWGRVLGVLAEAQKIAEFNLHVQLMQAAQQQAVLQAQANQIMTRIR
jgi:hypothetical protein